MSTGIYMEDCENVTIRGNRFHNIDNPIVAKRTKGINADNNVATYDADADAFRIKPLVIAIRRVIYGR
jgi:parallel beta-helix repeat protein